MADGTSYNTVCGTCEERDTDMRGFVESVNTLLVCSGLSLLFFRPCMAGDDDCPVYECQGTVLYEQIECLGAWDGVA